MIDLLALREMQDTVRAAAEAERELHLSVGQVQTLQHLLDDLVRAEIEAYLVATQDPAVDEVEERAFVAAASRAVS